MIPWSLDSWPLRLAGVLLGFAVAALEGLQPQGGIKKALPISAEVIVLIVKVAQQLIGSLLASAEGKVHPLRNGLQPFGSRVEFDLIGKADQAMVGAAKECRTFQGHAEHTWFGAGVFSPIEDDPGSTAPFLDI